ncbi:hypothetical protein DFR52_10856 [Hoeflea marina]|uniref:Uncharacterized protein n=1 Tax=Hoeflea marina TaxID=274592 RepID=A0A317PGM4_9HYPH|nr:hypothetical protein [Hoeflea marina]PWV95792.1 hypothetical protein DFR52_10856 [Hoeflea marina]
MDGNNFLHAPLWVRITALAVLGITLVFALAVVWYYLGQDRSDWMLLGLSLAQIAASGLVVALVIFFSARDVGAIGLQLKADRFLCRTLPRMMAYIDVPRAGMRPWKEVDLGLRHIARTIRASPTEISMSHNPGENAASYLIRTTEAAIRLRCQVNVGEITISYYFPAEGDDRLAPLKADLQWAIGRYVDINGYQQSWYFSREDFDGESYVSVHLTKNFGTDFLDDERAKLFVAQDVAASTRSILKDCRQRGIATLRAGTSG